MADEAWRLVKAATITNCFRHVGNISRRCPTTGKLLLPSVDEPHFSRVDADAHAATLALQENFNELVDISVLAASNRMSIDNLVAPERENKNVQQWFTDQKSIDFLQNGEGTDETEVSDSGSGEENQEAGDASWELRSL